MTAALVFTLVALALVVGVWLLPDQPSYPATWDWEKDPRDEDYQIVAGTIKADQILVVPPTVTERVWGRPNKGS